MVSPLEMLIYWIEDGKDPSFEWIIEHAPDGTLEECWRDSESAANLLYVYALTRGRWGTFDAARRITLDIIKCTQGMTRRWQRFYIDDNHTLWLANAADSSWVLEHVTPDTFPPPGMPLIDALEQVWVLPEAPQGAHRFGNILTDIARNRGIDPAALVIEHTEAPTMELVFAAAARYRGA